MSTIKILIQGYAKKNKTGWTASSTVVFIKSNNKNIIVDPGCNRQKLIKALAKNNLKTKDIDFVFLTHLHTDHALLAGIFAKAKILNSSEIYHNDKQIEHHNKIPQTDLKIIPTPGHTDDHCSLVVKTKERIYIVAGDVFWWKDDEKQKININKSDPAYMNDKKQLIKNRKKILKFADWIIPGHGKIFKTK